MIIENTIEAKNALIGRVFTWMDQKYREYEIYYFVGESKNVQGLNYISFYVDWYGEEKLRSYHVPYQDLRGFMSNISENDLLFLVKHGSARQMLFDVLQQHGYCKAFKMLKETQN